MSLQLNNSLRYDKIIQTFLSHRHSKICAACADWHLLEFTACMTLFSLLLSSRTFAFDLTILRTTSFWREKNVKKTTSFSLFSKAEMIHSEPIWIHRKQYIYLEDHFRGTNNEVNDLIPETIQARGKMWIRPYRYHILRPGVKCGLGPIGIIYRIIY